MAKWLVTGATGLLGANAVRRLSVSHGVVGTARRRPQAASPTTFVEADISSAGSRDGLVARVAPDVVLHAAAVSSIEACAADPDLATEVNVRATADLARQAAAAGARFILISTDAVFDGCRGSYSEDDEPSPASEYGRSKVAAERAALESHQDALVARVNFYGWSPTGSRSLAEFFHRNLSAGTSMKGFTDITVSTLYVDHLVDALVALEGTKASGTVHVASSEPVTKFDFGRLVAVVFGYSPDLVIPALSTEVLSHARGSNLSLDVSRFTALTGRQLPDQAEGVRALKRGLDEGVPSVVAGFANEG